MRRRRIPVALLLTAAVVGSVLVAAAIPSSAGTPYGAKRVVRNLSGVSSFTFAPDGDIFFTERLTGKIRRWDSATKTKSLFATVPKLSSSQFNELGLLGIALHPDYPATPSVYVYATVVRDNAIRMQVLRYTDAGGSGTARRIVKEFDTTAGGGHVGGRILFGSDELLYVVIGERFDPTLAQNLALERGKVLRYDTETDPEGDLTPAGLDVFTSDADPENDAIVSFGHRNSFGLGFDPENGNLWQTENGPECNDELNLIVDVENPNYGWGPNGKCSTPPARPLNTNNSGPTPRILPEKYWRTTIAPTGIAFCDGCALDAGAEGAAFVGDFNTGTLRRVALDAGRDDIASITTAYRHTRQILSIERGIDGRLYFSDGRTIFRVRLGV
ncbi:MAG: PQQ-dependent sugar dehydrogenase [Actinomycetota bacterium]